MSYMDSKEFLSQIIGATVLSVSSEDPFILVTDRGTLDLHHDQDCCESVYLEDVTGDVNDLVGGVITLFEERSDTYESEKRSDTYECDEQHAEDGTWTFYEIRTTKGDVTLRWLGTSNGYYSEGVSTYWNGASVYL